MLTTLRCLLIYTCWTLLFSVRASTAAEPKFETMLAVDLSQSAPGRQGKALAIEQRNVFVSAGDVWSTNPAVLHWQLQPNGAWQLMEFLSRSGATGAYGDTLSTSDLGWLAVGDPGTGNVSGEVHMFRRGGDNQYSWHSTLQSPTPRTNGQFGYVVQLVGDTLYVGAPFEQFPEQPPYSYRGGVHVFELTGADEWSLVATLRSPNLEQAPRFGYRLVASDGSIVVADPYAIPNWIQSAGIAYQCVAQPLPAICSTPLGTGQSANALFGNFLYAGNGHIQVAAPEDSSSRGSVVSYTGSQGALVEAEVVVAPDEAIGWSFGRSIASTPESLFVSTLQSIVHRYSRGSGQWERQLSPLSMPTDVASQSWTDFGSSMVISGDRLFVGAPGSDIAGWANSGAVFVYLVPLFADDFD